jgi:2-keto-4-pentenoate hydratase/2-oxohepta-3-ene-1,7-dioic acid hydratase in catechol pathway
MRIYRYRVGRACYYGELVSEKVLERCVRPSPDKFELHRAGVRDLLDAVELLVPTAPSKIVCVGRNYAEHAAEMGNVAPDERPLLFFKPPSCLIPHGAAIVLPRGAERVDYEGEIALVLGKRCQGVDAGEAYGYLLGVTAFNDVTERAWQKRDGQWTVAKGCDTFGPCGPYIDTSPAEALRLGGERRVPLAVTTRVNGELRQHGEIGGMTFNFASLISFISQYMTLEAGDLIATGTPPGVGPLHAGDTVAVELNCGPRLENPVADHGDAPAPQVDGQAP